MTAVTLNDLTTGSVTGSGVFDKLMAAAKAHLELEYGTGAIKGTEYAQVYLGQLQAVMSTALQFLATSQKIDLEAQLMTKQIALTQAQIDQAAAQTALVNQQKLNAEQELCVLKAQFDNLQQTTLRVAQETQLTTQKVATEKAQILALGVDDNSVVGRQKALYAKQAAGFDRDAEQKLLAQMLQIWSTQRMTDSGIQPSALSGTDDASIGRAVKKAMDGVGA